MGVRASGPSLAGWATGQLRGVFPFGPWSVGVWARYSMPFASSLEVPSDLYISEMAAGLGLGRLLLSGPFELRFTLDPSVAVVTMAEGGDCSTHTEGARVGFRLGANLTGTVPIGGIFRGVVELGGDLDPAGLRGVRRIADDFPPFPVFTAGLLLGVELVLR